MLLPTCIWLALAALNVPPVPQPVVTATNTITLVWDSVPTAFGYKIYQGPASRTYTNAIVVAGTSYVMPRPLGTNYFAVTCYDTNGIESDYSNEAVFPVPQPPTYGLLFNQGTTDGTNWVDLTPQPFLRLTNAQGGPLPWQWFRTRVETSTNWR